MNAAERISKVSKILSVRLSSGVVVKFRPALAGEAAAAGLLPNDTKGTKLEGEEYEIYKENLLEKAESLLIATGVDPVWVHANASPENGTALYSSLAENEDDALLCYLAVMNGVTDAVEAVNSQYPQVDRDQKTIALVSAGFGRNPLEVETLTLPEWIRLLRYARLAGLVKEEKKE